MLQEQLAEQAALHRTYTSNLERGELNPSLETIEKLENTLNIFIPALFINYGIQVESILEKLLNAGFVTDILTQMPDFLGDNI